MAKTPLLDWLQRESLPLNRRAFLQTAVVAGAGLAGLGAGVASGLRARGPKVVVVGGGLSGLSAAFALRQAGLNPTLLEASNRSGGRVLTERKALGDGLIAERGGEWIEPEHTAIRSLAEAVGVRLEAVPTAAPPQVWLGGALYPATAIKADLAALVPAVQRDWQAIGGAMPTYRTATPAAYALDRLSAQDWIQANVKGGAQSRLGRLLAAALAVEWGAEANQLSAIHLLAALGAPSALLPASTTRYRVAGGSDRLTAALEAQVGRAMLFQTRLTALRRAGDGSYRLDVAGPGGTRTLRADQVILALPLPVLRESVDWSQAGFSPVKTAAMAGLGIGIKGKLQITADGPTTFHDDGWGATAPGRRGLLVHWLGGEAGRRLTWGTPGDRGRYLLDHLAELGATTAAQPWQGRAILDDWSSWSPAGGATAFRPPGGFTTNAGREAEPEGCCHFAGEWTSSSALGRMEGAVESGQRAARDVLAQLQGQSG